MSKWMDIDLSKGCSKCGRRLMVLIYVDSEKKEVYCHECSEEK